MSQRDCVRRHQLLGGDPFSGFFLLFSPKKSLMGRKRCVGFGLTVGGLNDVS